MVARKRQTGEKFSDYKAWLKAAERWMRQRLRGRVLWPADRGTYVRKKQGDLS